MRSSMCTVFSYRQPFKEARYACVHQSPCECAPANARAASWLGQRSRTRVAVSCTVCITNRTGSPALSAKRLKRSRSTSTNSWSRRATAPVDHPECTERSRPGRTRARTVRTSIWIDQQPVLQMRVGVAESAREDEAAACIRRFVPYTIRARRREQCCRSPRASTLRSECTRRRNSEGNMRESTSSPNFGDLHEPHKNRPNRTICGVHSCGRRRDSRLRHLVVGVSTCITDS